MPNGVRARGNSRVANQRRNMVEDGLIHATTIIENAETVIIQAQEYDTSELDTRILQLENELRVMKKQNKKDKQQNKRVMDLIKNKLKDSSESFARLVVSMDEFNMIRPSSTENEILLNRINLAYNTVEVIGNPEDCKYKMSSSSVCDFNKIQLYIDRLEMVVANNKLSLDCLSELQDFPDRAPPTEEEFISIVRKMGNKSCDNNPKFYENTGGLVRCQVVEGE